MTSDGSVRFKMVAALRAAGSVDHSGEHRIKAEKGVTGPEINILRRYDCSTVVILRDITQQ